MNTMITKARSILRPASHGAMLCAPLLLVSLCLQPVLAQDDTAVDVGNCLNLESEAERRACIEAQVDEFLEGRGSTEASSPVIANDEAKADSIVAEPTEDATPDGDEQEYFGTIVSMHERLPSAYVIELDNGQVWEQTEPKRYPLRPGLEVRIYPTRWGTRYRLTGLGSGGHIQVRRLR